MKHITVFVLLLIVLPLTSLSQSSSMLAFKSGPVIQISDSLAENIVDYDVFRIQYANKANAAHIYYVSWSPNNRFIAMVVGDIFTGGYDDIWVYYTKEKEIKCITSVFPYDKPRGFRIPIWMNSDTIEFSMLNSIAEVDVPQNKIVSNVRSDWESDPSFVSPNGEFYCEYGSPGYPLYVYDRDGELKAVIGEGKTRGGSILGGAFSSDNNFVAIEQFMGHGESRILLMNLQTFSTKILRLPFHLFGSILGRSNWHPNQPILHVTDNDGALHFLDVITRSEKVLMLRDYYITGASWSQDGKQLALVLQRKRAQTYCVKIIKNPFTD